MQVRFIDVDGVVTRCLIAGDPKAYPILLLHGYGGTADVWIRNVDALGRDFYVIAPDMLLSGFTDLVEIQGPPQDAAAKHLMRLMDRLGVNRFCPIGTSYGGLIAALIYFAAPYRVDKLILNGSGTCFNNDAALRATLLNMLKNFGPVMESASIEGCRTSMTKQVYDPSTVPEEILPVMAVAYARPGMRAAWENGLHGLLDFEAGASFNVRDRLDQLDVETLVVWGRQDPGAVYDMAVAAMPRLPNARLVTFEECGHKPMFEYPDAYNDVLRTFLTEGLRSVKDPETVKS